VQKMRPNLLGHQGHSPLPGAQATRIGRDHRNPAGVRLPASGHRRGLLFGRAYRLSLATRESGRQCLRVHEHIIEAGGVLLGQVQADELRIRIVGGVVWLASALSVSSRLWLGGVVRIRRDRHLIRTLLVGVRACGAFQSLLLCTDGLSSYPK
jgi:hypothetical protein